MSATHPEITPQRFGRYVLLDRIGSGGMAEVYRAVLPGAEGFQRTFVVKRILTELSKAPDFVEMFVQEARICALLHHPNIVEVFDFGRVDEGYFLTMEYLRGRDLAAVQRGLRERKRPFPVPVAALIAHQVASGLAYAHGLRTSDGEPRNIVHRDVSPGNILCLRTGGVKLLDFGIAKAFGSLVIETTGRGTYKGKLSYMAPERVNDAPVDGRSNLFSLGVVLWEMLAGRRLFRGQDPADTMRNVLQKPIPAPSELRPDVPRAMDAIVLRALERDPALRYPTGQDMADDLEQLLADTKHQSRLLPQLLRELFGADVASTQLQLSSFAPPDELTPVPAAAPMTNATDRADGAEVSRTESPSATARPSGGRNRRRIAAAISVAGAALAGTLLWRTMGPRSSVVLPPAPIVAAGRGASPEASARPDRTPEAATVATVAPPPPDVPVDEQNVIASARGATRAAPPTAAAAPGKRFAIRKRVPMIPRAATPEHDRIQRGLSIDPFAEAAARDSRRSN